MVGTGPKGAGGAVSKLAGATSWAQLGETYAAASKDITHRHFFGGDIKVFPKAKNVFALRYRQTSMCFLSGSIIGVQDTQEGFLGDIHVADSFETFFALFLPLQYFHFSGNVAAV